MKSHRQKPGTPGYEARWTLRQAFFAVFFGSYFAAAIIWSFPVGNAAWNSIKEEQARPILKLLGAYQNWAMFAPDPIRIRRSVEARLTWQDGRTITLPFPGSLHGNVIERIRGEQFRKWSLDQIRLDRNSEHWQGAAGRFARDGARLRPEGEAPLLRVELIRRWSEEIRPRSPASWTAPIKHEYVFHRLEGKNLAEELRR